VIFTACTGFNITKGWKFSLRWCCMWSWSWFAMQSDFGFDGWKECWPTI